MKDSLSLEEQLIVTEVFANASELATQIVGRLRLNVSGPAAWNGDYKRLRVAVAEHAAELNRETVEV
jgi:hypothetical protein